MLKLAVLATMAMLSLRVMTTLKLAGGYAKACGDGYAKACGDGHFVGDGHFE
jgi:hypothetical protein